MRLTAGVVRMCTLRMRALRIVAAVMTHGNDTAVGVPGSGTELVAGIMSTGVATADIMALAAVPAACPEPEERHRRETNRAKHEAERIQVHKCGARSLTASRVGIR